MSSLRRLGSALALVIATAVCLLALTGQLSLYIHPRYFVFATIMAAVAGIAALADLLLPPLPSHHHDDHSADTTGSHALPIATRRTRTRRAMRTGLAALGGGLLVAIAVVALLVAPPKPLSAASALQRGDDPASVPLSDAQAVHLQGASDADLKVSDWAALYARDDGASLLGRSPSVDGFVTAVDENTFALTRFVVTCCAVDARPVRIPVHLPGWQNRFTENDWVHLDGTFRSVDGGAAAVEPTSVETIPTPSEPYEY